MTSLHCGAELIDELTEMAGIIINNVVQHCNKDSSNGRTWGQSLIILLAYCVWTVPFYISPHMTILFGSVFTHLNYFIVHVLPPAHIKSCFSTTVSSTCYSIMLHTSITWSSMCYFPPTRVPNCALQLLHRARATSHQHKYHVVHFSYFIKSAYVRQLLHWACATSHKHEY